MILYKYTPATTRLSEMSMQIQLPEQNLVNEDRPDGMTIPTLTRPCGMYLPNGVIARIRKVSDDGKEIAEYMTQDGTWEIGNMKEIESRPAVNMWGSVIGDQ